MIGGRTNLIGEQKDRRLARAERSRKKILESAQVLFMEFGFKETTIKMISTKAGVGYGTVYSHFPEGRDDIFLTIMEDIMEGFYNIADTEYTVNSKKEGFIFTQKNVESFLELATTHKKMLKVFYEAIGLSQNVRRKWEDIVDKFIKRIAQNVEQAIKKGLARNAEYHHEVVAGVLFYAAENYLWDIALNKAKTDYQTIARNLSEMYTYGLFK